MSLRLSIGLVALGAILGVALPAHADGPRRFGLFVGANGGPSDRDSLRHAEDDARRLRRVFIELGGMRAEDALLLESPGAGELLSSVRAMGRRAGEAGESMLVFYYSGHADDRALLLSDSQLPVSELHGALEGLDVKLQLQLFDACRSGALTRRKGARMGRRFDVNSEPIGEGRVMITSSAEWEDSQESDRLGGSFFTVHMVTGLRGAADENTDGRVTLQEAYRYVYGRTLESTRRSGAGPQHPTYRYDLRGRGDTVLTWPSAIAREGARKMAQLDLGGGGDYLIVNSRNGTVVAELRTRDAGESLALRPGRYRVSRRAHEYLHEGEVVLEPGQRVSADEKLTRHSEYARLVRKGIAGTRRSAHALWVELGARSALGLGDSVAPSLRIAYALALPWLTLRPRITLSAELGDGLQTPRLNYRIEERAFGLELRRDFDVEYLTLGAGVGADLLWLTQREADSREDSRNVLGFSAMALGVIESPPVGGFVFGTGVEVGAYSFPTTDAIRAPTDGGDLTSTFVWRAHAGVSYGF